MIEEKDSLLSDRHVKSAMQHVIKKDLNTYFDHLEEGIYLFLSEFLLEFLSDGVTNQIRCC